MATNSTKARSAAGRYGHVAVIGAGAWGTALAAVAAGAGAKVSLWAREPDVIESISRTRENARFLPGAKLPDEIEPTLDIARASSRADAILLTAPAQHLRAMLLTLKPHMKPGTPRSEEHTSELQSQSNLVCRLLLEKKKKNRNKKLVKQKKKKKKEKNKK